MLIAERLSKKYGNVTACEAISFSLSAGEIAALAGINGAGKTTLLKLLTGVLACDEGRCVVCGHDMGTSPLEARRVIGSVLEDSPLYRDMTVRSHLAFTASVYRLSRAESKKSVDRALVDCDLSDVANMPVDCLPKGVRQRLALALALVHEPSILVLDEPTSGLDPVQLSRFRSLMLSLRERGTTIVISTHILQEAESLCDRVLVIDSGSLKADLPLESFRNLSPSRTLEDSFLTLIAHTTGATP